MDSKIRFDILTLFPESVDAILHVSILGRAEAKGLIETRSHQIRDFTTNKQMQVDDYPYGGGRGAIMQADPLFRCWPGRTIYLSPCGRVFNQEIAKELAREWEHIILICGHYEGVDERFLEECVDEEISIGDYVLTGGEIACRLIPGVLPDSECYENESHWNGLLEYPQYSRPAVWHDREVPAVLLSGHHAKVDEWRLKESYKRTMRRRPDLFAKFDESKLITKSDKRILREAREEFENNI